MPIDLLDLLTGHPFVQPAGGRTVKLSLTARALTLIGGPHPSLKDSGNLSHQIYRRYLSKLQVAPAAAP